MACRFWTTKVMPMASTTSVATARGRLRLERPGSGLSSACDPLLGSRGTNESLQTASARTRLRPAQSAR